METTTTNDLRKRCNDMGLFLRGPEFEALVGVSKQGTKKHLASCGLEYSKAGTQYRLYPEQMERYLRARDFPMEREVISFHIVKGGVGKTTLTHAVGSRASAYGFKTLLVDLDQQSNLTASFGLGEIARERPTLLHVAKGDIGIEKAIIPVTNFLHILPAY